MVSVCLLLPTSGVVISNIRWANDLGDANERHAESPRQNLHVGMRRPDYYQLLEGWIKGGGGVNCILLLTVSMNPE